jgi:hypothetical protein
VYQSRVGLPDVKKTDLQFAIRRANTNSGHEYEAKRDSLTAYLRNPDRMPTRMAAEMNGEFLFVLEQKRVTR